MSATWAVLSDGKYMKILYRPAGHAGLRVLRGDDYAGLCYRIINQKPRGDTAVAAPSGAEDPVRLQADFLAAQQQAGAYERLLLVAPAPVQKRLSARLPAAVTALISARLNEDWLPRSNADIETALKDRLDP